MKIPLNHETGIDCLLQKMNNSTCFLSDWNKENDQINFSPTLIDEAVNYNLHQNKNNYFFIDEMKDLKNWYIRNVLEDTNIDYNNFDFSIASNGTSSAYLLFNTFSKRQALKVLLLTPIYFTYIKILKDLKVDTYFMEILETGKIKINFQKLKDEIVSNKINMIVLNDPLLGSGVRFPEEVYIDLVSMCKEYNVFLFIDFMYGGMDWNIESPKIIDEFLLNLFNTYSDIIIIESISKRLFINGIKSCIVYANKKNINIFESTSVYTLGSLVYSQISLFKQLYSIDNRDVVLQAIKNNTVIAIANFELIVTILANKKCVISSCHSGYYCLIGIPYEKIGYKNNMDIASELMDSINLLTIPHDRYLLQSEEYYYFRVNLSIEQSRLISAIKTISGFYNL